MGMPQQMQHCLFLLLLLLLLLLLSLMLLLLVLLLLFQLLPLLPPLPLAHPVAWHLQPKQPPHLQVLVLAHGY
jgi:hypothetical protein